MALGKTLSSFILLLADSFIGRENWGNGWAIYPKLFE
jgi:hypothetical protein